MNAVQQWWQGLQPRERQLLGVGGAVLAVALAWVMIWEPIASGKEERRQQLENQRGFLSELREMRNEARSLRARADDQGALSQGDLLSLANSTANQQGLGGALQRTQPQGEDRVQVWFEQASFDDIASWLAHLGSEHGVRIHNVSVDRQREPGRVNARIALQP